MDDTRAPFSFRCPCCEADINAQDAIFDVGAATLSPDRDWMLWEVSCRGCGTRSDVSSWLIDGERMFAASEGTAEVQATMLTPDAAGLLNRYLNQVSEARNWWLERLGSPDGDMQDYTVGLARGSFRLSESCSFGCSTDVLAVARGLRLAVEAYPFVQPNGRLRLGPFLCVASIDEMPGASPPWALHVSLSHPDSPEDLPIEVQHIFRGLFFTGSELERLEVVPGRTRPMVHWYLPTFPETVRVRIHDAVWVQASGGEVLFYVWTPVGDTALSSVALLEHDELRDVIRLCGSESGRWAKQDGSLTLVRRSDALELTMQPVKRCPTVQTARLRQEGVTLLHQLIDTVLAARVSGAVARGRSHEMEAELRERDADPEIRAWISDSKIALRAAHMMKAARRLMDLVSASSDTVTVSQETPWEHMMRGSWQRWMNDIRGAGGRHVAAVVEALLAAARPGQPAQVLCSEFIHSGGGQPWAVMLGKWWLPIVQSMVSARAPGATVSYRLGRLLITS